jgi:hypothetical protein
MIVNDNDVRRPESKGFRFTPGWTSLHSWIFLGIVALGLTVIGLQNRYYYLSPLGLGKAYRIDKVFGGIQEFDPGKGWVKAQIQAGSPSQPMSMMEPSMAGPPAVQMHMPAMPPPGVVEPRATPGPPHEEQPTTIVPKERMPATSPVEPSPRARSEAPASKEDQLKIFRKAFPDYGEDEFQLARDDLYPDWKKNVAPDGTWQEFLDVYKDFVTWWTDSGSPQESGMKLWRDYLATHAKQR